MVSTEPKREFFHHPAWMAAGVVGFGLNAATSGGPLWDRAGSLLLSINWAALLGRHVIKAHQRRKSQSPDINS